LVSYPPAANKFIHRQDENKFNNIHIYKYKNTEMREEWGNGGIIFRLPLEKYSELN
jgi:hypothetical protein